MTNWSILKNPGTHTEIGWFVVLIDYQEPSHKAAHSGNDDLQINSGVMALVIAQEKNDHKHLMQSVQI